IALSINKIERDREQAIKHKEKLLGQRDNFMAVLTHDLKNPLIGNEQVLSALMRGQLGQLTEGQSQLIGVVKQANHELLTMIKNLLALYRYDRDNPSFDLSEIDVAQVLQEAIANVQELASLYKAEISTNLSAELPLVTADFTALAQVLTNLLQNAIKSGSAEGSRISLEAKVESAHEQAEHRHVVVLLKDQGLGLTERELELLFYGYRQTAGGVEQSSGTALGLYLSYQIVRAMGGNLSCESKLGAGSTFRIELPLSPKSVAEVL
ncbi:MAG TPA: HAMP domain-containing sensor histidine kinase, partial [Candidatus Obscuribacter sp.]|nr:HAMP domain-containing sensor histidine kinase [Candidatus Obscuribacter sp.]